MPTCINDTLKHYKGDEPSPKGRGFCAHAEKVGTTKKDLMVINGLLQKHQQVRVDGLS